MNSSGLGLINKKINDIEKSLSKASFEIETTGSGNVVSDITKEDGKLKVTKVKLSGGSGSGDVSIIDDLTSESITDALSANQGRVLNNKITEVETKLNEVMADIFITLDSSKWVSDDTYSAQSVTVSQSVEVENITSSYTPIIGQIYDSAVPTVAELEDFSLIAGWEISKNKIVFYAISAPNHNINLVMKAANLSDGSTIANYKELLAKLDSLETVESSINTLNSNMATIESNCSPVDLTEKFELAISASEQSYSVIKIGNILYINLHIIIIGDLSLNEEYTLFQIPDGYSLFKNDSNCELRCFNGNKIIWDVTNNMIKYATSLEASNEVDINAIFILEE